VGSGIDSRGWWLGLQLVLGALGAIAWGVGALILHEDFLSGLGLGLLVSALLLRFGRRAAADSSGSSPE
jgi:hypothetical protein